MQPRDDPDADSGTAQVHPLHFTNAMADLAREGGADIRLGAKVTSIVKGRAGPTGLTRVEYVDREKAAGTTVTIDDATDVVVTAGPWTARLLPQSNIEGSRAHSVVYDTSISPYAIFTSIKLPKNYVPEHRRREGQKRRHKGTVGPEIYSRPGQEVYVCGTLCPRPGITIRQHSPDYRG